MKVAVSLPDSLSERADDMASRLGLNRSQLFATAIEQYLGERGDDPVTSKLDELAEEFGEAPGETVGRRLIDSGAWEW